MPNQNNKIFFTNYQKILKYFAIHPSGEYIEKDIQKATAISKAGVNFALRALSKDGLVERKKRGKLAFYSINLENPLIRQIKVLLNLIEIDPLIHSIKDLSDKITLFGSASTGTNIEESDIDLFVLANKPNEILEIINKSDLAEKVQAVIKKPIDYLPLKKKDPVFYEEVSRGILIWEKKK